MVKKTLLSLAIAASAAGMAGCQISSVEDNKVDSNPVVAGTAGTSPSVVAPIFSAGNSDLPVNIDLLFASASATDGTAEVSDTSPPVTTMISDLAGFSSTATIDIAFNSALDKDSIGSRSVFLIRLLNNANDSTVDPLDVQSSVNAAGNNGGSPFAATQPTPGVDYAVDYVELNNGATPTIRISPLKPLASKTKYLVVLTDSIKDAAGNPVQASAEYELLRGSKTLPSASLAPVRGAIQGWEQLASGYVSTATGGAVTQSDFILSYAFTTEAKEDILLSMAAPENYIFGLLANTAGMESLLSDEAVDGLVAGAAAAINAANASTEGWTNLDPSKDADRVTIRLNTVYKTLISNTFAKSIIAGGAAKAAAENIAAGGAPGAGTQAAIDNWNTANPENTIPADPATWTSQNKDAVAQALGQYNDSTDNATLVATAANGAGDLLKDAAKRPAARNFRPIGVDANADGDFADENELVVAIPNTSLKLPVSTMSMQGMLSVPQFMAKKSSNASSFWTGSTSVGGVIDTALGNELGTTPPKDADQSLNVTYRFPFAQYVEDAQIPVLVTYPADAACVKPADGWKTIIFHHGITTDRTSSIGFANQMAAPTAGCYATVAIDHPTHGADASSSDRNGVAARYSLFNPFNVAGYAVDASTTPFATTLASVAQSAGDDNPYAGLTERHENLALDATQQVISMNFTPGSEAGNSGDFFINLLNMQQTRDHLRQSVMDLLNLNASIENIDVDGDGNGDLDDSNIYFVGHSLGAIVGMTYVAVNNAVAGNTQILAKELNPIKAAIFANPGGQLPKLLENSPNFSAQILPGLAASGLTQGNPALESFFSVFQAPLDSVDPVNFTALLKSTSTPTLILEMVGGGSVAAGDQNTNSEDAIPDTGLSDMLIAAGVYPADTVVPNNANPPLNGVETGKSYLAGTDPLISLMGLTTVTGSVADGDTKQFLVSKFNQGTHGTVSSADAPTVFAEIITQAATFFASDGEGLTVGDTSKLKTED